MKPYLFCARCTHKFVECKRGERIKKHTEEDRTTNYPTQPLLNCWNGIRNYDSGKSAVKLKEAMETKARRAYVCVCVVKSVSTR